MACNQIDYPTPTKKRKPESHHQTTTTATATTGPQWARMGDGIVTAAAVVSILVYAAVGILIGLVLFWSLSFWLQSAVMILYLAAGLTGWLPWQIGRKYHD